MKKILMLLGMSVALGACDGAKDIINPDIISHNSSQMSVVPMSSEAAMSSAPATTDPGSSQVAFSSVMVNSSAPVLSSSGASSSAMAAASSAAMLASSSLASSSTSSSVGSNADIWSDPMFDMVGFATVSALGVATTTGGAAGATVEVRNYDDLVKYITAPEPYTLLVYGTISPPVDYVKLSVASNKSIIGMGSDATFDQIGLAIKGNEGCLDAYNPEATYVSNIIIRNIFFTNLYDYKANADADGITIECFSHHVWLDHNSFIYPANQQDQGKTDGALDVKRGSDYVTISWNHFYHYNKTSLVGHVDSNNLQDEGRLHVTYHHNYFENTQQRNPRIRFGQVHLYNNYLFNDKMGPTKSQVGYFTTAGPKSDVYIEANNLYVDSGEFYVVSEDSSSDAKVTFTDDNIVELFNPNAEWLLHINNGQAFNPLDYYEYRQTLTPANELRTLIPLYVGAGKLPTH